MTAGKDPRKLIAIAIAGAIETEAPSGRLRAIAPFVLVRMDEQPKPSDIEYLVNQTTMYYNMLRENGIPEALAVRIVGDWYSGAASVAVTFFHGKLRRGAEVFTHRMRQGAP